MTSILSAAGNFVLSHLGASFAGVSILSGAAVFFAPKLTRLACAALGRGAAKEIAAVEAMATGNPEIDARLHLVILTLMDVANRKLPASPGADKKAYVMAFFAKSPGAVQTAISAAIDQLWTTWKAAVDAGVTAPQEAIIAETCAKLAVLPK